MNDHVIRVLITAHDAASKTFAKVQASATAMGSKISGFARDNDKFTHSTDRMEKSLSNLSYSMRSKLQQASDAASNGLRKLNSHVKDIEKGFDKAKGGLGLFQIAMMVMIGSLPAIISLVVQLGAQLLALGSSAGIAAAALGAGLAAAAAQAVPILGILLVAVKGVANVMAAVKAANTDQAKSSQDASKAADQQRQASENLRKAQERVLEAQQNVNKSRKEARRDLEDMTIAQEKARLATEKANLGLEQSQRGLKSSRISGDLTGVAEGQIGVASSKIERKQTNLDAKRGEADLGKALSAGVEGSDKVLAAKKQLADANRDLADAQREAAKTAKEIANGSSALTTALNKLSPAERRLYQSIMSLQAHAKIVLGGVKANIIDAFTEGVKGAEDAIKNTRIQNALFKLSAAMRDGMEKIQKVFLGAKGQDVFASLTEAATKNVPHLSNAFANLAKALGNLALAGRPFVEWMVKGFERWSEKVEKGSRNTKSLTKFFEDGQKHLKAWMNLLTGIGDLFLALSGGGAADSGLQMVNNMGNSLHKTADRLRESKKETKAFWDTVNSLNKPIVDVFKAIGKSVYDVFKGGGADSIKLFSQLLITSVIPAINTLLIGTSAVTGVMLKFLSIPVIGDITKWAIVFMGASYGIAKFSKLAEGLFFILKPIGTLIRVALVPAFKALGKAIIANPLIAAIAGIALAIVLLDRKFHFIKPTIEAIGNAFKWLGGKIVDIASTIANDPVKAIKFLGMKFLEFELLLLKIWTFIPRLILGALLKLAEFLINGPITDALKWLGRAFKKLGNGIADVVGDIWHVVTRVFKRIVNWVIDGPLGDMFRWYIRMWRRILSVVTDVLGDMVSVVRKIGGKIARVFGNIWDTIKDNASDAFRWILKRLESFWDKFIDVVGGVAGKVKDAFGVVAKGIKNVFVDVFKGIYNTVREIINGIANGAAKIANLPGIKNLTGGGIPKNPMPPFSKLAQGGMIKARPGGIVANIAEDGHDEVVLSTDPKHANRTAGLLGQFLSRTGLKIAQFAKGGYVQGAIAPGQAAAKALAQVLFGKGFNVTSAHDGTHAKNSYHYANGGSAIDFGNSVNSLSSVWSILFPIKKYLAELFGPQGLYKYGSKFSNAGLQAGHMDHVHAATAGLSVKQLKDAFSGKGGGILNSIGNFVSGAASWTSKALKNIGRWITDRIGGDPIDKKGAGPFRGMAHVVWDAYRKRIKSKMKEADESGDSEDPSAMGSGATAKGSLKGWLTKALKVTKHFSTGNLSKLYARAMQESGGNPKAINNYDSNAQKGTPSKGILQVIDPTFQSYKLAGYGNIWNPIHNAIAAIRYMIARYHTIVGSIPGQGYASGGELPGREGDAIGIKAHAGEMVLNRRQQWMLGGPQRLRGMFGFNGPRGGSFADGGEVGSFIKSGTITGRLKNIDDPSVDYLKDLQRLGGIFRKYFKGKLSGEILKKIERRARDIVADDGPIAGIITELENMRSNFDSFLKRRRLQRNKAGFVKDVSSQEDLSSAELRELRAEGRVLGTARKSIDNDLDNVNDSIRSAKKSGKKGQKRLARLQTVKRGLEVKLASIDDVVANNLADQLAKQNEIIDAELQSVQNAADRRNFQTEVKKRINNALGIQTTSIIEDQISNAKAQINDLQSALKTAGRYGNADQQQKIRQQIEDLNTSIVEMTAERLSTMVEMVNSGASSRLQSIDTRQRIAQISRLGRPDYNQIGSLLSERGNVLSNQRGQLSGLLSQAQGQGNQGLINTLNASIADLEASILENTLAVKQNSVAALQQRIDETTKRSSFLGGVADASAAIIKGIGDISGVPDTASLLKFAQNKGNLLKNQSQNLQGYLKEFLGGNSPAGLGNASGANLVSLVNQIVNSTDLSKMIQEKQDQFQSLVDALLQNEQAVNENTSSIKDLQNTDTQQSFTTTAWEKFRQAIFNGSGGLLPSYQIPAMATGGTIKKGGLFELHPGEKVTPADQVNNMGNTSIDLTINEAGGYADPTVIAKTIAWELKSKGRV